MCFLIHFYKFKIVLIYPTWETFFRAHFSKVYNRYVLMWILLIQLLKKHLRFITRNILIYRYLYQIYCVFKWFKYKLFLKNALPIYKYIYNGSSLWVPTKNSHAISSLFPSVTTLNVNKNNVEIKYRFIKTVYRYTVTYIIQSHHFTKFKIIIQHVVQ